MACRVDDGGESQARQERESKDREVLLCSACSALERLNYNFSENPALDRWWGAHKEHDARNKLKDAARVKEFELAMKLMEKPAKDITQDEWRIIRRHSGGVLGGQG